jgi:hypothetical protein
MIILACWGCSAHFRVRDPILGSVVRCPTCGVRVRVTQGRPPTEDDWRTGTNLDLLLAFAAGRASRRKVRLFASACVRLLWDKLEAPELRRAVVVTERFLDGRASAGELHVAANDANEARNAVGWGADGRRHAASAVCQLASSSRWEGGERAHHIVEEIALAGACGPEKLALLRDMFGNPFRMVLIARDWLTHDGGQVARLAEAAYDERAFDRLPILGDALEDAGCDDEALLAHLRGPAPHTLGCWTLDALLERA